MKLNLSIPTLAALLFGAFSGAAVATLHPVLSRFAVEVDIEEWMLIAVPVLMATLVATVVYRRAADKVTNIGQSLSRGLLVAVLTWLGLSALATWVWCVPAIYGECFRHTLLISGALGGGQMLLASLAAAAITGYTIRRRAAAVRQLKE